MPHLAREEDVSRRLLALQDNQQTGPGPLETISKGQSCDSGPKPSAQALPTTIDLETQSDLTAQGIICSPREAPSAMWIQKKKDYLKSVAMKLTPRNTKEI